VPLSGRIRLVEKKMATIMEGVHQKIFFYSREFLGACPRVIHLTGLFSIRCNFYRNGAKIKIFG
jgi:hypothetical protein